MLLMVSRLKEPPKTLKATMYLPTQKSTTQKTKVRKFISDNHYVGIGWMLKTLMELDEFQINKVSNEQLHKFFDFLENPNYIKFFVWLN